MSLEKDVHVVKKVIGYGHECCTILNRAKRNTGKKAAQQNLEEPPQQFYLPRHVLPQRSHLAIQRLSKYINDPESGRGKSSLLHASLVP